MIRIREQNEKIKQRRLVIIHPSSQYLLAQLPLARMFKQMKKSSAKFRKPNELNKLRTVKFRRKSIALAIKTPKEKWTRSKIVNGIQGKDQGSVVDHLKENLTTTTDLNLPRINPFPGNLTLLNLLPVS